MTRPRTNCPASIRPRLLACERLQSRDLMANDVVAFVDTTGVLHIYGDDVANTVHVIRSGPHSYAVGGDWAGSGATRSATTINGRPGVFRAENVAHIVAYLQGGNDTLVIGSGHYGRDGGRPDLHNVTVNMGTGQNEYFRFGSHFDVTGHVQIDTGPGTSKVHLLNNNLQSATINTGNGNDIIDVEVTNVARTLSINTRGGADQVELDNLNSTGAPNYRRVGELRVDLGAGNDRLEIYEAVIDRIYADLGDGHDHFQAGLADIRSGRIHAQSGDDSFWLTHPTWGAYSRFGFERNIRR